MRWFQLDHSYWLYHAADWCRDELAGTRTGAVGIEFFELAAEYLDQFRGAVGDGQMIRVRSRPIGDQASELRLRDGIILDDLAKVRVKPIEHFRRWKVHVVKVGVVHETVAPIRAMQLLDALLVLPLLWNAHLILGFLNFVAAIPLALAAIALAVRIRTEGFTRKRAALLGVLALLCFYTHVVPFGLMMLGCFVVGLERDVRAMARYAIPFVPALLATLVYAEDHDGSLPPGNDNGSPVKLWPGTLLPWTQDENI